MPLRTALRVPVTGLDRSEDRPRAVRLHRINLGGANVVVAGSDDGVLAAAFTTVLLRSPARACSSLFVRPRSVSVNSRWALRPPSWSSRPAPTTPLRRVTGALAIASGQPTYC